MNNIDILVNLMNRTVRIQPNLESSVCTIDEQLAIRNLISENKELKEENERIGKLYYEANENCIKYEKDYIPKSKVEELLKKIENRK